MTANKSFTFIREADLSDEDANFEPLTIEINGASVGLVSEFSSIDLVQFAAGTMQGGRHTLFAIDQLFSRVIEPADREKFFDLLRNPAIGPKQLGEIAQGIVELYTERPTSSS